ncbi:MAG: HlyD family efflux transporter periplasmic adaptor subunit [Nitrospirae bacterium]|nr:HlyD family efflux transporter periplasmic adaptor subunit [Nitrospirota bacterium]
MRPHIRRRILVIVVSVAVVLAVVYGFMPKPVQVDAIAAKKGPMRVTVDEEGKTRVRDRFVISAPVAGYLRRVELDVGDSAAKGQVVAELEPLRSTVLDPRSRAEALAALSASQAALNAAKENARSAAASEDYAQKNLERQKKLYDSGYVAKDSLDQADADAKRTEANRLAADARVRSARADVERAQSTLGHSAAEGAVDRSRIVPVRAPVDGSVLKVHHESEGVVDAGEPVIDIGDPRKLEVKVEVLSADAVAIRPGSTVYFERWGGEAPLAGTVRTVEPEAFTKVSSLGVEEQRVLVIADITSLPEEWKRLGDGYRVEASFIIWEGKDVLQVPASSLFRKGEGWAGFVIDGGRARTRSIKVGHRNGLIAEIMEGLSEKDTVISHPDDRVSDGVRVRQRSAGK